MIENKNFTEWLLLTEAVQMLQEYLRTHQIVHLGKIGWWQTYSAVKVDMGMVPDWAEKPAGGLLLTLKEYKSSFSPTYQGDDWAIANPDKEAWITKHWSTPDEIADSMTDFANKASSSGRLPGNPPIQRGSRTAARSGGSLFLHNINEAASRLGNIGFPSEGGVLLLVDLKGRDNHITGGGVGGYSTSRGHGITVDRNTPQGSTNTVVHEHAHQYWYRLSKGSKKHFDNWWRENVVGTIDKNIHGIHHRGAGSNPLDQLAAARGQALTKYSKPALEKEAKVHSSKFLEILTSIIPFNLDVYFKLREMANTDDNGKIGSKKRDGTPLKTTRYKDNNHYKQLKLLHSLTMSNKAAGYGEAIAKQPMDIKMGIDWMSLYPKDLYKDKEKWQSTLNKHIEDDETTVTKIARIKTGDIVLVSSDQKLTETGDISYYIRPTGENPDTGINYEKFSGSLYIEGGPGDKLLEMVEFDEKVISDEAEDDDDFDYKHPGNKTQLKENWKLAKRPMASVLAPKKSKEDIDKIFTEIGTDIAKKLGFQREHLFSGAGQQDEMRLADNWYSTFVSILSRNAKKEENQSLTTWANWRDFIENVFIATLVRKVGDAKPAPTAHPDYQVNVKGEIGKPVGNDIREIAARLGLAPSSYAAANPGELWAVSVEHLAAGQGQQSSPPVQPRGGGPTATVSKELRKLIWDVIHGGPGGERDIEAFHDKRKTKALFPKGGKYRMYPRSGYPPAR